MQHIVYSVYNSQLEDTLKNTSCLTRLRIKPRIYSYGTRKGSFLRMTVSSTGCTLKGILFFLSLLHESIKNLAFKIVAVHIVHTISSRDHGYELPGNYPVVAVVMVIYSYVERIWRIPDTPDFLI